MFGRGAPQELNPIKATIPKRANPILRGDMVTNVGQSEASGQASRVTVNFALNEVEAIPRRIAYFSFRKLRKMSAPFSVRILSG